MKKTDGVVELHEPLAGRHIDDVCADAITLANKMKRPVHFKFNDTDVTVQPDETVSAVVARWDAGREAAHQAWINSPEYKKQQEEREAEEKRKRSARMVETAKTEAELRDANVPWPLTPEQLSEYIASLVTRDHDYGTCVYAMSMAAVAAFNYVAGALGVTGFQASCADLDILRRTRHIDGPYMLIKGEDALYPQYDLVDRLLKALDEWKPWLKEQAAKKLAESSIAHPDVIAHWKKLAEIEPDPELATLHAPHGTSPAAAEYLRRQKKGAR